MGLKNMSLLTGAAIAATGGTPLVFADDGITISNGVHLVVPADTDYMVRRQLTAKVRAASFSPNSGVAGKDKKSISYVVPITYNGGVVFNTIRIEREIHPSLSATDVAEMMKIAAQLCTATDTDSFWATGSLS